MDSGSNPSFNCAKTSLIGSLVRELNALASGADTSLYWHLRNGFDLTRTREIMALAKFESRHGSVTDGRGVSG